MSSTDAEVINPARRRRMRDLRNYNTSRDDEPNPTILLRNYKNKTGTEAADRISSLTDELLHRIMSFMNTKYAVQTCVLSKRWHSLWKSLPYLDFNFHPFPFRGDPLQDRESPMTISFNNFIAQVLLRRHHTDLVKVYFQSLYIEPYTVEGLIAYAVDHKVQQLTINSGCLKDFVMPQSFYTCRSLTALDMLYAINLPKFLALPSLKSLYLHWPGMTANFFNPKYFSGCPNLETLKLINIFGGEGKTLFVNAPNLKRVELSISQPYEKNGCKVVIDAPGLLTFHYRGVVPIVCSSDDLASIDDVYFDICNPYISEFKEENEEFDEKFLRLINTCKVFRHAKSLTLSLETAKALGRFPSLLDANRFPWSNLKYLKVEFQSRQSCNEVEIPGCVLSFFLNSFTKFCVHRRWYG